VIKACGKQSKDLIILRIPFYSKEASWIYLTLLEKYGGNGAT
jgi:hypothetical protein